MGGKSKTKSAPKPGLGPPASRPPFPDPDGAFSVYYRPLAADFQDHLELLDAMGRPLNVTFRLAGDAAAMARADAELRTRFADLLASGALAPIAWRPHAWRLTASR